MPKNDQKVSRKLTQRMAGLDPEERALVRSIERGEWRTVKNKESEIRRLAVYARAALQKTSRVNIRLSPFDLDGMQKKALEEGIPYQTLMASVIHKYVTGRLVERSNA